MKNKIIAIVINTSWNVFNFRRGLLKTLQAKGCKIVIIAPKDDYSEKLESFGFEYHDIAINGKGTHPIEDIKLTYTFYKLYKEIRPDVILHYTIKPNIYGTIAASLLGIHTINNIAGLGTLFVKEDLITSIAKKLYKYSQAKANHIFFQNKDDKNQFEKEGLVQSEKCSILPGSGIDVSKYIPIEKDDDGVIRFLLIARMLWEKGIGEYVDAAKIIKQKYNNVEFQLLGFLDVENRSAISRKQMNEWVKDGHINYLGVTDDVPRYIAKADCIVLPSFYREGTPRILLESASMAKPIITTDNVGCRDVVDDGINGYLCEVRNADDLALKMEMMLELSEKERVYMGKAGRGKMIEEYDEYIVIQKYLEIISKVSKVSTQY